MICGLVATSVAECHDKSSLTWGNTEEKTIKLIQFGKLREWGEDAVQMAALQRCPQPLSPWVCG